MCSPCLLHVGDEPVLSVTHLREALHIFIPSITHWREAFIFIYSVNYILERSLTFFCQEHTGEKPYIFSPEIYKVERSLTGEKPLYLFPLSISYWKEA